VRAYWILDCTFGLSVGEESSSELLLNAECVRDLLWNPECALGSDPTIALIRPGVSIGCIRSKEDNVETSIEPGLEIEWNLSEHPPRSLSSTRPSRICPHLPYEREWEISRVIYDIRGSTLKTICLLTQAHTWSSSLVVRSHKNWSIRERTLQDFPSRWHSGDRHEASLEGLYHE
jgi:hypothetical protein